VAEVLDTHLGAADCDFVPLPLLSPRITPHYTHLLSFDAAAAAAVAARFSCWKNSLIMNNPDLILRKSILTKNDAITQHK
jgi:hypothetical protein